MAEDTIVLPKVEELQLDGKLKTSFPEIKAKLSKLPFYDVGSGANSSTFGSTIVSSAKTTPPLLLYYR